MAVRFPFQNKQCAKEPERLIPYKIGIVSSKIEKDTEKLSNSQISIYL
jgi:hypothetical protein